MTYITGNSTGSPKDDLTPTSTLMEQISSRAGEVTAGIAAGRTQYVFRDFTDEPVTRGPSPVNPTRENISKTQLPAYSKKPISVATREHVARLLRECQKSSQELADSDDQIDSALLGGQLTNRIHELWDYRQCRESDWVEILNIVQIAVPAEEFEFMPKEKRLAIVRVFNEALVPRTVGPAELDRCLKILTEAGFNVWAGLSDNE